VPMVASVQELREVRRLLGRAMNEVDAAGHGRARHIPLGMMIEVPSAVVMADVLAREAEFFSIGTNDLIQYTLAIDRGNRSLAPLASPFHPAILRMIRQVTRAASMHAVPVALCGAMASDPLAAVMLIGLGLRELSMEAAAIPEIKEAIRRVTMADCERAAEVVRRARARYGRGRRRARGRSLRTEPVRPVDRHRGRLVRRRAGRPS
jgi:phosphoenolpyruvate-protein phosphotransferase (PTS system enzyme I)